MKLLPEIFINASPEAFLFDCEGRHLSLDTYVYLHFDEDGAYQFVSIGERSDIPDAIFVRLFENQPLDPSMERFELLRGFLEYGIGKMVESSWYPVLKPVVTFRNAESFQTYFSGYHKFVLEAAALAANASKVQFE